MRFFRKSCCQREASSIAKALIKWNSLPVTLMNSAQPADSKNAMEYLSSLQHGAETFQNSRKDPTIFLKISKTCINFMAWFRGVVYHLPWHMIHNIKPTDQGSYHVKGFWDCPMYSWNRWVLEMSTWVETPCKSTGGFYHCEWSPCSPSSDWTITNFKFSAEKKNNFFEIGIQLCSSKPKTVYSLDELRRSRPS